MSDDDRTPLQEVLNDLLDPQFGRFSEVWQKAFLEGGAIRTFVDDAGEIQIEHIPDSEFYAPFDEVGK